MGYSEIAGSVLSGFGYGSLILGWGLQQSLSDVIASFCLAFDNNFKVGDKIEIFGQSGDVTDMGLRSVKVRVITSGETLCIPNSKIIKENVTTYDDWKTRRVQINFRLAIDDERNDVATFPELCNQIENDIILTLSVPCKPSTPGCYLVDINDYAYKFEVVFYVQEYNDKIHLYKTALSEANCKILVLLKKEGYILASGGGFGQILNAKKGG